MNLLESAVCLKARLRHQFRDMDPRDGPAKSEMESVADDSLSWELPKAQGLYDPQNEHEACGVGFIVAIDGRRSHKVHILDEETIK